MRLKSNRRARATFFLVGGAVTLICLLWVWQLNHITVPQQAAWLADEIRAVTRDRLSGATLIGGALGVSGLLLRTASANPLADAEITGVNSGAAFGAVLATTLTGALGGSALLPGALVGALAAASITIAVSFKSTDPGSAVVIQKMVLLGLTLSAFFSALTAIILVLDEAQLTVVLSWMSGELAGIRATDLIAVAIISALIIPAVFVYARAFDALAAGEDVARGVGANPGFIRLVAVSSAVLLISACVAASGPIGFLGLLAATTAHAVCGPHHRLGLVVAYFTGTLLLLVADVIAAALWAPAETPVGIVTAIMGVPILLWGIGALQREKR